MNTAERTFSVVVNTTDRASSLHTLLRALEHQSYPHFEVIVVVGPTHDNTLDVLKEYAGRVRVLRCPTANLDQSRNIGLLAARGEIVAYIDDDAVPSDNWLEQFARLFADTDLDATGGVVYLTHPKQPMIQHRIGLISSLAEQVDVRAGWLEQLVPPGKGSQWAARMMGTNMAFRRKALLEIGGFDEFYEWVYDEADVMLRLTLAGKYVQPVMEAAVYHVPASSRNRVAFTYKARWWIQTKAAVYFSIKNGLAAGDAPRAIAVRCLHLVHGHWLWSQQLCRGRQIGWFQSLTMRVQELRGGLSGAWHGLFSRRRLIHPSSLEQAMRVSQPIEPFQTERSAVQPTVDPVSGYCPSISLPESPLRVCLLSSSYPPTAYDGVGRLTHLMARGLFEGGHSVHVITLGSKDQTSFYDGAYVHQLANRLERYGAYAHLPGLYHALNHSHAIHDKVKRLMLNDGVQLVDSPLWQIEGLVTAVSGIAPVVVRLVTARRQIAAMSNERGDDARLIGELEQVLLERATYLLPNTRATLDTARKVYQLSLSPERYSIVPYGIVPAPEEAVRAFDLSRILDTLTVLYVGRLERRKGILDLFEAIPLVAKKLPNVRFIIAGADNSRHDGFQARHGSDYSTYFHRCYSRMDSQVKFLGGVSEEQLQRLYQSCDLFVAPSRYESFGLIYLEAMNYAKPVIGCHAGGIPEVIEHGQTGLLVEPEAPTALAEAMITLLQSPTKLREMGLAGRQRLMNEFTYLQMARNFERAYRQVIQNWNAAFPNPSTMQSVGVLHEEFVNLQ